MPKPEAFIEELDGEDTDSFYGEDASTHESLIMDMEEIEKNRAKRQRSIQRILAARDPERMQEGVEAYKRDLPSLLEQESWVVAYDGSSRIGMAPTRPELYAQLREKGIQQHGNLFIKKILPMDEEDENLPTPQITR